MMQDAGWEAESQKRIASKLVDHGLDTELVAIDYNIVTSQLVTMAVYETLQSRPFQVPFPGTNS